MTGIGKPFKGLLSATVLLFGLTGLTGCSGVDGIQFEGALFDAVGVGTNSAGAAGEPKLASRNPLVVPPDTKRLPPPGSAQATASGQQSWPQDPEQVKIAKAQAEQQVIAKYCGEKEWWLMKDAEEFNRMTNDGSLCLSALGKMFNKQLNKP